MAATLAQGPNGGPSLIRRGGVFIIRQNGTQEQVPIRNEPIIHPEKVVYRKDDNYAVWDSRGLTVRKGRRVKTSRLPDISLTPKLFTKDELEQTKALIAQKKRSKNADTLAGSLRVGNYVFFLLRWDDSDGNPWLEALIDVDLSNKNPQARLLGRFQGFTIARRKIDEQLFDDGRQLYALTKTDDDNWGIAKYDPSAHHFDFRQDGKNLLYTWHIGPKTALVEEGTDYGSKTIARLDVDNGAKRILQEFRGSATLVNATNPTLLRVEGQGETDLLNLDTGSEKRIQADDQVVSCSAGVVVWPKASSKEASLYDPTRWDRLSTESSSADENSREPAVPSSRSHSRRGRHGLPADRPNP